MVAEVTWVEVADTAVKIGLSGIIAAIGGYVLARRNQRHDFDRETFKRRQDIIRNVSLRFASVHKLFFDVAVKYHSLLDYIWTGQPLSHETQAEYSTYMCQFRDGLHEIHALEADLLLLGGKDPVDCLRTYRLQATDVNDMVCLQQPTKSKSEVQAITQELFDRREKFYHALSGAFKCP